MGHVAEVRTSAPSSSAGTVPADVALAIAKLFETFSRLFGQRWAKTYEDPKSRDVWARACVMHGLAGAEITATIGKCTGLAWPPTFGEFANLARPNPWPHPTDAMAEAVRSLRAGWDGFAWSHAVVEWTARRLGWWQIRHASDDKLRAVWMPTYAEAIEMARAGTLVVERPQALPSPDTVSRGPITRSIGLANLDALRRQLFGSEDACS